MRTALKAALVVVPLVVILVGIRALQGGAAERWRERIAEFDPAAKIAVDEEGLIVIAPDVAYGRRICTDVLDFRRSLIAEQEDLVGPGRDQLMVVVLFSTIDQLQACAGEALISWRGRAPEIQGLTRGSKGAIFLPPGSDKTTLRHETVHLIMAQSWGDTARFSPWLSEGLAQLFEPPEPGLGEGSRRHLRGALPDDTLDVNRLILIEDLDDFVGDEIHRNYLEAAVLTAFLYLERPRELLARYVGIERRRVTGRALAFHDLYRCDVDPFRRDLRDFIRRQRGADAR